MKLHREGGTPLLIAAAGVWIVNRWLGRMLPVGGRWALRLASLGVLGAMAQFFRNPVRYTPPCDACVFSGADGTVVAIERVYEPEYFKADRLKVSVFMSVVNVHVNRVPLTGRLAFYRYHPGQYLMAYHPKSSELNERNTIVIERSDGQQVLMRQIAGILARRICFYLDEGQTVAAGQELGFIRFGSRCDLFLPLDADIQVKLQQKVTGGETVIARL